jgi:hypothetical protein
MLWVQIDCGNKCALSVNGCVPRRIDSVMEWPVGAASGPQLYF